MNFNHNVLINNIEKIYKNCSLISNIYADECKNLQSFNLFDNYIDKNFNLLIEINSNGIIKNKYELYLPIILKIKNLLNVISLIVNVGYLYYGTTQQQNLIYDDYINLFNASNINLFVCDDNNKININNLKKVKILNNYFAIVSVKIDSKLLNNNLTFESSSNTLEKTIGNLNKLLKNFSHIIRSHMNDMNDMNYINKSENYLNKCFNKIVNFGQICKLLLNDNMLPNTKVVPNNKYKTIYIDKGNKPCTISSTYGEIDTKTDYNSDSSNSQIGSSSKMKEYSNTYKCSKSNDTQSKQNIKFKNILTKKLIRKIKKYKKLRLFNKCFLFVNVMLVILFFFEKMNLN